MRTIKFRAWNSHHKQMWMPEEYNLYFQHYMPKHEAIQYWDTASKFEYVGVELMQFTGLLDKNGKEIYEGDVILYIDWDRQAEDTYTNQGVVEYGDMQFYFTNRNDVDMMDIDCDEIEVIGNIHENPELTK